MKKTILFLCACAMAIGGFAQTNLASGKTPVIIKNVTGNTYDSSNDLAWATDGIKDNASKKLNIGGKVNETSVSDNLYIDLGSANRWGSVVITFSGQKPNSYWVYGSATAPTAETEYKVGTNIPSEWTLIKGGAYGNSGGDDTPHTENIPVTTDSEFQYFVLITDAPTYNGKLDIFEIEVYQYEASVFTTFMATASATTLNPDATATITTTAKDQFGADVAATITYASDNTSVVTVENGTVTAVANGTANVTVTATAGEVTKTETIAFTVETPFAAPSSGATAPTADAENVLAVFSSTYGVTSLIDAVNGWGTGGFDGASRTNSEIVTLPEGDYKLVHIVGNYMNSRPAGSAAPTDYTQAHVAIYPKTATSGRVFEDNAYANGVTFDGLTPGQWNYVSVPVSFTKNFVLVALDGETEFYLDHFYFSKPAAGELSISDPDAKGKVTVSNAAITSENVAQIEAIDAAAIDLSGVTVEVSSFTPKNPNTMVIVAGEITDGVGVSTVLSDQANRVVVRGDGYAFPVGGNLTLTGAKDAPIWFGQHDVISSKNIKYTRTINSGATETIVVPVTTDIPDGLTVYEFSAATSSEITFTKTEATQLTALVPYVVTASENVTISIDANAELDIRTIANNAVEKNGVTFMGNGNVLTTDGTQHILSNGMIKPANGAKVGAYRAYFKGINAASVKAMFGDIETSINLLTGEIGEMVNGKWADGKCYDLSGRRVSNAQRGIYIVNGKKVVIK